MSDENKSHKQKVEPTCPVRSNEQFQLQDANTPVVIQTPAVTPTVKVPVVVAEPTIQVVVEADIPLDPPASEIKRVVKNVFLNQVKLVPVQFAPVVGTDFFNVTRAKLFVAGFIRKNIEYASANCNGKLHDRIADVAFSGFADLTEANLLTRPIIGISGDSKAAFLSEKNGLTPRLDKFFFQNLVKYNEQPFGELVAANFFELDFSPHEPSAEGEFHRLREKIVMDLTVKVLQVQQLNIPGATQRIPDFPEGTIG